MPSCAFITPRLFLGSMPTRLTGTRRVHTVEEAVEVILVGGTAVLQDGRWVEARAVLRRLGLNEDEADRSLAAVSGGGTSAARGPRLS